MQKFKYIILMLMSIVLRTGMRAQLPVNDAAWILQNGTGGTPNLSDEFDATYIDSTTKWHKKYSNYFTPGAGLAVASLANGAELNYPSNLIMTGSGVGNGTLKIKADTLTTHVTVDTSRQWYHYSDNPYGVKHPLTFAYQGGVIWSQTASYQFGYIEISAKYPSRKYSLWPAFWLWGNNCTQGSDYLNEVDIAENAAQYSYNGNQVGTGYFVTDTSCMYEYSNHTGLGNTVPVDSLSGAFHKFALKWDPQSMTYYFDDAPIFSVYNSAGVGIPQNGMAAILNFCIDPGYAWLPASWTINHGNFKPTSWANGPQYFEIDYLRYYKLGKDCDTALTNLCTPAGYDRKIKKSIATDNTCTPNFNQSTAMSSYTLRATDFVLLDAGTTINPSGTGYFAIEILACP